MRIARGVWSIGGSLVLVVMMYVCATSVAWANPYGIAGTGALTKLGMPSGCSEYTWGAPTASNPISMVRPWEWDGSKLFYDYDKTTDTIDDPVQFASWVTAHPGKTWIIGNEPDGQDNLTTDQYARMFHRYYTTIRPLDSTAKFVIGAISGQYNSSGLVVFENWYQAVLTSYQTQFSVNMPIDIWNFHQYAPGSQTEDPDRIINELVNPFIQWCHTVQGGVYASCPVWITECPVSDWSDALSNENMIAFMQLYMPRLEQTAIQKWFWFVSNDWDGNQGSCALVSKSGQVTPVGAAYSALAKSYPNAVPPIVPFVPLPTPETVLFDFSGALGSPWFIKAGWWSDTGGELRHTGVFPAGGTSCGPLYVYQDLGLSFRMKINSTPADLNWTGVLIRAASRLHSGSFSGYLFYVRKNGEAGLYDCVDGTVASVPGAVPDPTVYHSYQIYVSGFHITWYIDGVKIIDWTDPNSRYASGYVSAQVYKSDGSFDDFALVKLPRPAPVVADDGAYTTNLSSLHAAWDMADTEQTGFQYSVGLSAGATDVIPWTFTTNKSATLALTLNPASTYYVNVQAVYPGGIFGPVASTDGITAAVGAASLDRLKRLAANTFALIPDKVVSGVFADGFYIQEANRSSGMKVVGTLGVLPGDTVTLVGSPQLSGQEAVLTNPVLISSSHGDVPSPVGMNNLVTGGAAAGLQPGTIDYFTRPVQAGKWGSGLSPIGLLVKTTGQVTYVDPSYAFCYIDDGSKLNDGSGWTGVRVPLDVLPAPSVGLAATVTGCCGAIDVGGNCARYLRPRDVSDGHFAGVTDWVLRNPGFEDDVFPPWAMLGTGARLRTGTWASISAHSGSFFVGVYGIKTTMYSGCLRQIVCVPAGNYQASVWSILSHSGSSNPEAAKNRTGIDPTGGSDPAAASVVWSDWDTTSGTTTTPWRQLSTPTVTVTGDACTVFLQYVQTDPVATHINCFDDAVLVAL